MTAAREALLDLLAAPDDAPALVEPAGGERTTYGELRESADRLARSLAAAGAGPGDAVAMSLPNGPEIVTAFLGVVAAGAAAAPLNQAYTAEEFRAYLEDLRPRAMLFLRGEESAARAACAALGVRQLELTGACTAELGLGQAAAGSAAPRDPEAVALLLHTSGTTSKPKGVPIRQRNLAASARAVAATYGLSGDDASHCVMPLFHVHGLVASTLATLASGGCVIAPRRFSASAFWGECAAYGATWYSAVPTIHRILLSRAEDGSADHVGHVARFARSCSSALPGPLMESFEQRFGLPLVEAYGMTEAAHQMTSNPLPPEERRAGSVGRPTGTEIAILDEDWRALPGGAVGEVCVRGPGVVDSYRANPEATAASFRDGWFRTGDSGLLSPDGYLSLAGRIKELINRGGEKISPHEVEDALLGHPDVVEAVAFALPDAKYGETVGAAVVTRSAIAEDVLRAHCGERLAAFKVPARVHVVDAIPKGPTGKVQRRLLAEQLP
ncbi:MAG TPA: acyl--CoA ligase [Gaiellales bacterium]|jgi:acyl-CoA synthetase (AMP-forming)/AMP-acid ligase II|nr:acyl--CoA ligase [Gaiellales bacterium]